MFSLNLQLDKQLQLTPKLVSPQILQSLQQLLGKYRTGKDRKKVTLVCFFVLGISGTEIKQGSPVGWWFRMVMMCM